MFSISLSLTHSRSDLVGTRKRALGLSRFLDLSPPLSFQNKTKVTNENYHKKGFDLDRVRFLIGCSAMTLLAPPLVTLMLADAGTSAFLANVSSAVMLANLRAATLLALALDAVVVTDACAPAYLALAPAAVMLKYR